MHFVLVALDLQKFPLLELKLFQGCCVSGNVHQACGSLNEHEPRCPVHGIPDHGILPPADVADGTAVILSGSDTDAHLRVLDLVLQCVHKPHCPNRVVLMSVLRSSKDNDEVATLVVDDKLSNHSTVFLSHKDLQCMREYCLIPQRLLLCLLDILSGLYFFRNCEVDEDCCRCAHLICVTYILSFPQFLEIFDGALWNKVHYALLDLDLCSLPRNDIDLAVLPLPDFSRSGYLHHGAVLELLVLVIGVNSVLTEPPFAFFIHQFTGLLGQGTNLRCSVVNEEEVGVCYRLPTVGLKARSVHCGHFDRLATYYFARSAHGECHACLVHGWSHSKELHAGSRSTDPNEVYISH
mmetsp:Transcript_15821/g.32512  ORF Transcript_15821/g.32512 Transcript_15821/m.32512 type:complete len:351 (+) Transcript_15821:3802-4854(+)